MTEVERMVLSTRPGNWVASVQRFVRPREVAEERALARTPRGSTDRRVGERPVDREPEPAPQRFERLLVMNTALGTGDGPLGKGFLAWRAFSNSKPDMDIAGLMKRAVPSLSDAEAAAYAAPYPDARYKAGVRRFPNLVPDRPDAEGAALSRRAREFWSRNWAGKSFMAIGMKDPVLGAPAMRALRATIRNCPPPLELAEAGHFTQEAGVIVVEKAMASFSS